jgi:hypothetical protein
LCVYVSLCESMCGCVCGWRGCVRQRGQCGAFEGPERVAQSAPGAAAPVADQLYPHPQPLRGGNHVLVQARWRRAVQCTRLFHVTTLPSPPYIRRPTCTGLPSIPPPHPLQPATPCNAHSCVATMHDGGVPTSTMLPRYKYRPATQAPKTPVPTTPLPFQSQPRCYTPRGGTSVAASLASAAPVPPVFQRLTDTRGCACLPFRCLRLPFAYRAQAPAPAPLLLMDTSSLWLALMCNGSQVHGGPSPPF